jgi:hypothetical protein
MDKCTEYERQLKEDWLCGECGTDLSSTQEPTESAWIKELEENAKDEGFTEGNLWKSHHGIAFAPCRPNEIWIGGTTYTIQQLQDLINHMRKYANEDINQNKSD